MEVIAFLQGKAVTILTTLLMASFLFNGVLYAMLYFTEQQLDTCKANEQVSAIISKSEKDRYTREVASYDKAIIDIAHYYDGELKSINEFTKDENETECDSAYRVLRTFKY